MRTNSLFTHLPVRYTQVFGMMLTALFTINSAFAAPQLGPRYQIELIVFKYLQNNDEVKSQPFAPLERASEAITLRPIRQSDKVEDYQQLPRSFFRLNRYEARLKKDKRYQVLLHEAWRQPISDERRLQQLHIFAGKAFDSYGRRIKQPNLQANTAASYEWELDGRVGIHRRGRLEVGTHLWLRAPEDKSLLGFDHHGPLVQYLMAEQRRIKLDEVNYFDHARFGLLLKISQAK